MLSKKAIRFSSILTEPDRWCQYARCLSKSGERVGYRHPNAGKVCLDGACELISYNSQGDIPYWLAHESMFAAIEEYIGCSITGCGIEGYNDDRSRSFEEIKKVCELADEILNRRKLEIA